MGWDATLSYGRLSHDWGYTYNVSPMLYEAAGDLIADGESFTSTLNGMSGADGAPFLHEILKALVADPAKFEAMNPDNGWGNYDGLVDVIRDMERYSRGSPNAAWTVS